MRWYQLPSGNLVDLEHVIGVDRADYKNDWYIYMTNEVVIDSGPNFDVNEFFQVLTRYRSTQNVYRVT